MAGKVAGKIQKIVENPGKSENQIKHTHAHTQMKKRNTHTHTHAKTWIGKKAKHINIHVCHFWG